MCQFINYRLITGQFIGLVIQKSSNSVTHLFCNTTINGVSYKSCIMRYWEKGEGISQFLDQLIYVNQVGNSVVYSGGTIELVRKPESVYFCTAPQVVAKVFVLEKKKQNSEVHRKIGYICPCQTISSVWTWETAIMQSFYLMNINRKHSKNILVKCKG